MDSSITVDAAVDSANTCACGCDRNAASGGGTCSATEPAVLLPAEALLVPFDNRTKMVVEFADLKRRKLPDPMPCPDNYGVSINWHLLSDFEKGWTARVTLFNWGDTAAVDWFAAVELGKAMAGYEKVYSMDGKVLSNPDTDTLFLYGLPGLNYLVAETNGSNPRKRRAHIMNKIAAIISPVILQLMNKIAAVRIIFMRIGLYLLICKFLQLLRL